MRPIRSFLLACLAVVGLAAAPEILPLDPWETNTAEAAPALEVMSVDAAVPGPEATADPATPAPAPDTAADTTTADAKKKFPDPVDVIDDPAKAYQSTRQVMAEMGLIAGLIFALMCIVATLSARAKPGSFLDRGNLPVYLTATAGLLGSLGAAYAGEITWLTFMGVVLVAVAGVVKLTRGPNDPKPAGS